MVTKLLIKHATRKPRLKHVVCKPCWELKYCPYGPLVEFFPLPSDEVPLSQIRKSYRSWVQAVCNGTLRSERDIYLAIEKILCLEPKRWAWISEFKTEELCCSVFGHICPVFFSAEPFTETKGIDASVGKSRATLCSKWCAATVRSAVRATRTFPITRSNLTTSFLMLAVDQPRQKTSEFYVEDVIDKRVRRSRRYWPMTRCASRPNNPRENRVAS